MEEEPEDAHDEYTRYEQLRRKRGIDGGDIVIYGGWVLAALILVIWTLRITF